MDKEPESKTENTSNEPPAPEVLRAQFDDPSKSTPTTGPVATPTKLKPRHNIYRPSHKATFIGLAVVVAILVVNGGIILFLMNIQGKNNSEVTIGGVKISPQVLQTLGVSRNTVGKSGAELVVNPDAKFIGNVTVGGDISIAGQLKMNSNLLANDATFTKLQAGDTSLGQLNVNGDATISNLTLRSNLSVAGSTTLQGPVVIGQLLTVNNNMNVAGNLALGGTLSARYFDASSLTSDTTLTIGGHIITRGSSPSVSRGSGLQAPDTISLSGSDTSGTVDVNIGAGSTRSGIIANITFANQYSSTPNVVITPVGPGVSDAYVFRTAAGFSIGVSSIGIGGHSFDYIVMSN